MSEQDRLEIRKIIQEEIEAKFPPIPAKEFAHQKRTIESSIFRDPQVINIETVSPTY